MVIELKMNQIHVSSRLFQFEMLEGLSRVVRSDVDPTALKHTVDICGTLRQVLRHHLEGQPWEPHDPTSRPGAARPRMMEGKEEQCLCRMIWKIRSAKLAKLVKPN